MTRKENNPDTNTFHFFNANPKNRITTDCVVRAICTALQEDYVTALRDMTEFSIKTGYDICDTTFINKYLTSKGWVKHKQPRKYDNTKYLGKEFCKEIAHMGTRYVANIGGGHTVAIVDCKVWDTWDSTYGTIGTYWCKP